MQRRWLGALVLVVGLTAPVWADVTLAWKFKEGDVFYLENVSDVKQSIEFMGNAIPQDMKTTTVSSFKVLRTTREETVLEQKIESVKSEAAQGNPQGALAEKMTGSVLRVTLNARGAVTKIEGFDEVVKKLTQGNEKTGRLVKMFLSEDMMKQDIQEAFAFMPGKAVNKGDKWDLKTTRSMGPMGGFAVDQTYVYEGKEKDGERIGVKGVYAYQPPKGDAGGGLFKVTKGDFKTDEAKGFLIFDPDKGRLVRHEFTSKQKGSLTVEFGGMEVTVEMQQEAKTVLRVLDKWVKEK